jgi:phosphonate ABC transporter permease subunit PhnE
MNDEGRQRQIARTFRTFLLTLVAVLVLMYAIQATEINLEEPLEPQRQVNLVSLLRELARPDLFTYETDVRSTNISIRMPCPEEVRASQITVEGRQVTLSPNCATTTQDVLILSGQGFPANARGVIGWHPPGTTVRRLAEFRADSQGNFRVSFTMPDIRSTAEPQRVEVAEVVSRRIVGFSETSETAVARIIETIFMALMASTIGTILAIPISFLAARNLMADVSAPLAAIMAALAALPIGGWLGGQAAGALVTLSAQVSQQAMMGLGALVLAVVLTWPVLRLGPPVLSDERRPPGVVTLSLLRVLLAVLLVLFGLGVLAHLGLVAGRWLEERLGILGFLGNFVFVLSDLVRITLPALMALIGAMVAASLGSRYGQEAAIRLAGTPARLLTAVLTGLGTAVLIYGLLYSLNWICLLGLCRVLPQATLSLLIIPAVMGSVAGLLSLAIAPKRPIPIGFTIYNVSRTVLNALRAIEPVILGFVFVVWVGIGPFAGIMALTLHSIADLGKLFSEQVENIAEGPREAVKATGANQIQTIAYAVIPQIVPHYLAFIFYRWDINVRMSTIIGFVGGGGIGLVLQRFANLTQYRQASVMIIAIAIVVAVLDYISSRIRERII